MAKFSLSVCIGPANLDVRIGMIVKVRYQGGGSLYNYSTGRITSIGSKSLIMDCSEIRMSKIVDVTYDDIIEIYDVTMEVDK